ncbi:hypothetical protein DMNBHIDG_00939 [Candidatus Methanoperedenaceae archaeon GB37]|nr:hypothetical protein DMNBHIDG_00939 [Candidatus Methanoperedenaceae archaeon GB37]
MVVSFKIIIYVAPIMVILAVIDYAFQKWEFEKESKNDKGRSKGRIQADRG